MSREVGKSTRPEGLKITKPRQARSRATMERILTVVEELLVEKPFELITVAEIANRSASAPTAIYARFSDKQAILLAVHERFRERAVGKIIEAITDPCWAELTPEEFLHYAATELLALYRDNYRLLRSVLLSDNTVMHMRVAELGITFSTAIVGQLSARVESNRRADAERDLDFAVRMVLALAQQGLLFGDQPSTRFVYPAEEIVRRMTQVLTEAWSPYRGHRVSVHTINSNRGAVK